MYSTVLVPGFLSRRALAGAGILALHLLVAYVLLTALMPPPPAPAPPPIIASFIHPPPVPAPPVVAGPQLVPAARVAPLPVPVVQLPPPPVQPLPEVRAPAPTAGGAAPEPALRLLGRHQLPDSVDYYPPDLIRQGVTGATEVGVCVDERGVRSGEPSVVASSGNARLDQGALNIARHGRYARAVRGDTPVGNCYHFRIVFRVH